MVTIQDSQVAKQTEFPSQVLGGVEGKKKSPSAPGKFRACHTADLFSASTLVEEATCRIIELIASLSSADP